MKTLIPSGARWLVLLAFGLAVHSSRAVILFGSGDPAYNTTPPTGALTNSGWQDEGQWGGFLGTPIAPHYFIAARHVGGSIGQTFTFDGASYITTAYWDDPNSDLRIWKVSGQFPTYAPLYTNTDEANKPLVDIGRGTQRGDPVEVMETQTQTSDSGQIVTNTVAVLHGWKDGAADGVMRWGENKVVWAGSSFLMAAFTGTNGPNEAYLSSGDSSGGVFIQNASGVWCLAGLNYGIEGPFSTTSNGPAFYGAIFDESGLYENGILIPEGSAAQPAYFYATRISSELAWIQSIVGVVQPASSGSSTGSTQPPPQLNIRVSGADIVVSYPTNAVGYTLQSSRFAGSSTSWVNVTNASVIKGANWEVTLPLNGAGSVFRLQSGN